jgi:hypothetical protein
MSIRKRAGDEPPQERNKRAVIGIVKDAAPDVWGQGMPSHRVAAAGSLPTSSIPQSDKGSILGTDHSDLISATKLMAIRR